MSGIRPFVWLTIVVTLLGCAKEQKDPTKTTKTDHLVEVIQVKRIQIGLSQTRSGSLRARREVKIFTQEAGRINALPKYEGDHVNKGERIAQLDDKLLRAQFNRARAKRVKAEQDVNRLRKLFKRKIVSDEEIARAETDFEVTKADEVVLRTRLAYTDIHAPIEGVVSQRLTEPGNIVNKYTHILTLSDPASLITDVTVSELVLPKLAIGDLTQVRIDALGEGQFAGRIVRIYPNLDPVTRRGKIEVELNPVPQGAMPGQFSRVQLAIKSDLRLMIPFSGLRRDQGGEFAFVVDEKNQVRRTPLRSGLRIAELVEVLEGLNEGQRVVIKGFLGLKAGQKIKIVPGES